MAKPYFILTALSDTDPDFRFPRREIVFGDYDRETVAQERRDMLDSGEGAFRSLRVHRVPSDRQIDIDAFVREINQ